MRRSGSASAAHKNCVSAQAPFTRFLALEVKLRVRREGVGVALGKLEGVVLDDGLRAAEADKVGAGLHSLVQVVDLIAVPDQGFISSAQRWWLSRVRGSTTRSVM